MCIICTNPIESLVSLTALNCSYCSTLVSIPPELVNLTDLSCSDCPRLTTIPPELVNLRELDCSDCPRLAIIPPTLVRLVELFCYGCPLLASIPPTFTSLTTLYCYRCPLLVAIPSAFVHLDTPVCFTCPWLPQNSAWYPNHLPSLLRLQRWFRTGRKQTFKRWICTRAFNEWIFHPDRIGGKLAKRQLEAELGAMRPAKRQRVE